MRAPDWAELLKRVHDVDALACQCGGRLNFIALILNDACFYNPRQPPPFLGSASRRSREIA